MNLIRFWKKHFLCMEVGIVILLTLLLVAWFYFLEGESYIDELMHGNRTNIYITTATIAGSLLGFSVTTTSIMLGFSSSDRLSVVRGSAHYPVLWKTFFQAIQYLGCLTVTSLLCLIWDRDSAPVSWLVFPFFMFFGLSVVRLARVLWILERVIEIIIKPQAGSEKHETGQ